MLHQAVVAAATADRGLGAELAAGDFKGGVAVVIQAAHQPGVEHKGNLQRLEPLLHQGKALPALRAEGISQGRGIGQQGLGLGVLGIEHPQRVGVDPALGIGIELISPLLQPGHQLLAVGRPVFSGAEGIELQGQAAHPEIRQEIPGHRNRFHVEADTCKAQQLHADLMELALATGLGPLVTKHRPGVPEPLGPLAQQAVLDRGSHHRSRALGPEGATAIAPIDEGVHLLTHHIGGFANAAGEELGGLQQGRANFGNGGAAEVLAGGGLNLLPEGGLLGQ